MTIQDNDEQAIRKIVELYFTGTYSGNAEQLKQAFHADAHITGNLNGASYDWTLAEFIDRIINAPSAASKNEVYDKKILFLDKTGDVAMVKAQVKVGEFIFVDYITLLKINGQWLIRNKSFTS